MSLVLLVAPSGQGKTVACLRVVELAKSNRLRVSGLLSLPVYQDQDKVAISLHDITTGQERILARKHQPGEKPEVGIWKFDAESLVWGQEVLASLPLSDMLVIDEIGPLEVDTDQGLTNALDALREKTYRLALVTLRPSLVEKILEQFNEFDVSIRVLDKQNRDTIPDTIVAEVLKLSMYS